MLNRPDKDALRAMLESQVQEKLQHDPDAVTTYAAQPVPDRKPYTSKPTVQDKAFHKELEQFDRGICRQHALPCPIKNASDCGSNRRAH